MIKNTSSDWCLACDPNYANNGISGNVLQISITLEELLASSCYDHFVLSESLGNIHLINTLKGLIDEILQHLENVTRGDNSGTSELTECILL